MTKFYETEAGRRFIATADSRETSRAVMTAIAFFARDEDEAIAIWNGDAIDVACTKLDIWEHATSNGANVVDLCWGADGDNWAIEMGEQDTCPEHRQPIERCPARCMDDEEAMALVARILLADAAPDLLAACVATLAHCEPFYGEDEAQPACFDAMRAAILKAKGA